MNYISNLVALSQITYPTISKTPFDVLKHIFFTNGNGIDFDSDGDILKWVDRYTAVKAKDVLNRPPTSFNSYAKALEYRKSREEDDYERRGLKALLFVEERPFEDMFSVSSLFEQMKTCEYRHYLEISRGYFKGERVGKNTDPLLIKVYINCLRAVLLYSIWDGKLEKESVFSFGEKGDDPRYLGEGCCMKLYEEELERVSSILLDLGYDRDNLLV